MSCRLPRHVRVSRAQPRSQSPHGAPLLSVQSRHHRLGRMASSPTQPCRGGRPRLGRQAVVIDRFRLERRPGIRANQRESNSPVSYASTTAWTRSRRLSFIRMCVMWVFTVVSLM